MGNVQINSFEHEFMFLKAFLDKINELYQVTLSSNMTKADYNYFYLAFSQSIDDYKHFECFDSFAMPLFLYLLDSLKDQKPIIPIRVYNFSLIIAGLLNELTTKTNEYNYAT